MRWKAKGCRGSCSEFVEVVSVTTKKWAMLGKKVHCPFCGCYRDKRRQSGFDIEGSRV